MGFFRRYSQDSNLSKDTSEKLRSDKKDSDTPADQAEKSANTNNQAVTETSLQKTKGRQEKTGPTLTRKEAEALRLERLHPNLSKKEQRARNRQVEMARREKAYTQLENSPERHLLRDMIDNRWSMAEFALPGMILLLAVVMIFQRTQLILVAAGFTYFTWVLVIIIVVEMMLTWSKFKKLLAVKYPHASRKGLAMYLVGRMVQIRRFRQPGPRITRGSIKDWRTWTPKHPVEKKEN